MRLSNVETLNTRLPDSFSQMLLTGGLQALSSDNPIRAHLFAATMREIVGHLLGSLAPDDDLIRTTWFVEEADRPTRRQRITFAIQGGLSAETVDKLEFDADEMHETVTSAIKQLNKRTHVRPSTLLVDPLEIELFANDVVDAVLEFFNAIDEMRATVGRAVVDNASAPVLASFVRESNCMIDELSTHSYVEQVEITEVRVKSIGLLEIEYEAEGLVYVELNYGSSTDREKGDGASMRDEYPFTCSMTGAVDDLSKMYDVVAIEVDTSSFYADDADD
jgi:hypothetical protein